MLCLPLLLDLTQSIMTSWRLKLVEQRLCRMFSCSSAIASLSSCTWMVFRGQRSGPWEFSDCRYRIAIYIVPVESTSWTEQTYGSITDYSQSSACSRPPGFTLLLLLRHLCYWLRITTRCENDWTSAFFLHSRILNLFNPSVPWQTITPCFQNHLPSFPIQADDLALYVPLQHVTQRNSNRSQPNIGSLRSTSYHMITKCVSQAGVTLVTGTPETYGLHNVFVQLSDWMHCSVQSWAFCTSDLSIGLCEIII